MKITDKEICEALLQNKSIKRSWWADNVLTLDNGGDLCKKYQDMKPRVYFMSIADLTAEDWVVKK